MPDELNRLAQHLTQHVKGIMFTIAARENEHSEFHAVSSIN
jgi:uncharacterized membrane protein